MPLYQNEADLSTENSPETEKPGYFAIIPADVRYDDSIPPNAKLLYGEISALLGKGGFCFATNQYFADIYGLTPNSVGRLMGALEKAGYIRREVDRDKSGQIVRRKLYLSMSLPDVQPVTKNDDTTQQDCGEGITKNGEGTNTSITDIDKENIKRKSKRPKKPPMEDKQLREHFIAWINEIAPDDWNANVKNALFHALCGFYAPRETEKQEPSRTEAAFTALTNRLLRFSGNDPTVMIDILERSTTAGWKGVFPLNEYAGNQTKPAPDPDGEGRYGKCL